MAGVVYAAASGAGLPLVTEYLVPLLTAEDGPRGLELIGALMIVPGIFLIRTLGSFFNAFLIAHAGMYVLE